MNIYSDSIFTWEFFHKLEKWSALFVDNMTNHEMKLQQGYNIKDTTEKDILFFVHIMEVNGIQCCLKAKCIQQKWNI